MKRVAVVLVVLVVAAVAYAQTTVKADQGRPGNEGPWPVTVVNGSSDGGATFVIQQSCSTLTQKTTDAGTAVLTVPTTAAGGRVYVQICNSSLNASTSQVICCVTSQPTFSAASCGDVLSTGDCATYNIGSQDGGVPWCIGNASNIALNSAECVP